MKNKIVLITIGLCLIAVPSCWAGFDYVRVNGNVFEDAYAKIIAQAEIKERLPLSTDSSEVISSEVDSNPFVNALLELFPDLNIYYDIYETNRVYIETDQINNYFHDNIELVEEYDTFPNLFVKIAANVYPEIGQAIDLLKQNGLHEQLALARIAGYINMASLVNNEFMYNINAMLERMLSKEVIPNILELYGRPEPEESIEIDELEARFGIDIDDENKLLSKDNRVGIIEQFLTLLENRFPDDYKRILTKIIVENSNSSLAHVAQNGAEIYICGDDFFDTDFPLGPATPERAIFCLFHEFGHIVSFAMPDTKIAEWYDTITFFESDELFASSFASWITTGSVCDIFGGEDVSSTHGFRQEFFDKYFSSTVLPLNLGI